MILRPVESPSTPSVIRVLGSMSFMMVEAKICLIHETVVQHKKNVLGIHKTNLTVVKVQNCPIYTQCCDTENACCFDYSWFWSTVGIVLFLMFLGVMGSAYGWYKKKHYRMTAASNVPPVPPVSATSNAVMGSAPLATSENPRLIGRRTPTSLAYPKPPVYTSVSPMPIPQPGTIGPDAVRQDAPPPYSAIASAATTSENYKSVYTQTIDV